MISFNPSQILLDLLTRMLISFVSLILGLAGLLALVEPGFTGETLGLIASLAGLTEIRTYGGFLLGFVVFIVWCCLAVERSQYALLAISLMMLGAGLARIAGFMLDGMPITVSYVGLGTEVSVALAAAWLLEMQTSSLSQTVSSSKSRTPN